MKVAFALALSACGAVAQKNPVASVLSLLGDLQSKLKVDGAAEAKAFSEYRAWCINTNRDTGFAIETSTNQAARLDAKINELSSDIEVATSKIGDLAAAISKGEAELRDGTTIRKKEREDYVASENELMDTISALSRAISVLEKEMAKNPAALAQVGTSMQNMLQAFSTVLDAASVSSGDRSKLLALAQSQAQSEDGDEDAGAPAAATYKTHSTNILDVLEDLKEKAETQLSALRKAESNSGHNWAMLEQSLEDQAEADRKEMDEQKDAKAAAQEEKATAERDLKSTKASLADSKKQLDTATATCAQVTADHEATVAARSQESAVIAEAQKVLTETSSGAVSQTYSFVQIESNANLAGSEVIQAVRQLAKKEHSSALAQLASRIAAVAQYGSGEDRFAKIKGLIRSMISKLEKEAGDEATEKSYCDEQIAKTEFKKGELEDDVAKQTSKIDRAASRSVQLKAEIRVLENELSALAKKQAEMDSIRTETHADYVQAKADLELGLTGVRQAIQLLREYYGSAGAAMLQQPAKPELHSKSTDAGHGIIDILEVCESDFAANLAEEEQTESDAQTEYEKVSQENAVTKKLKEQDVRYKTQDAKAMDSTVAEYTADRRATTAELEAVLEYYAKIKDRCIAKPEKYEERKRRREAEIAGLKAALDILREETATSFAQTSRHGSFLAGRGSGDRGGQSGRGGGGGR